ncbi:hypothetical protein [Microbacterium hominis]|uniref:hypothetical protein n=1 Tax=Microbacterium hominis TaxID=162426 RepID=UPI0012E02218|nr:hypothetical protein [Microbacterium hominis]
MAIGDDAVAAGFPVLTGNEQASTIDTEINKSRDLIAQVKGSIPGTWPVSRGGTGATNAAGALANLGIGNIAQRNLTISGGDPSGGNEGDIWLKVV